MNFPSPHHHHLTAAPPKQASASPLAFLDDPFRNPSSTFLFFSTIALASALIFHLMRHHYQCARTFSGACPSCAQIRKESQAAGETHPLGDAHNDGPASSNSRWAWTNGGTPGPGLRTGDLSGPRAGTDPYSDWGITASSTFYAPLSRNQITPSHGYEEAYCDAHTSASSSSSSSSSNNNTAFWDPGLGDADLEKVRREHSERCRQPNWPATLQKVVVGDVKESLIAKRRRSTLKRLD